VWYDRPENALADLPTLLANVMVYGSPNDLAVVEHSYQKKNSGTYGRMPRPEYSQFDYWRSWHERFGMPVPPLPRRRFQPEQLQHVIREEKGRPAMPCPDVGFVFSPQGPLS
jgi:hypothetical protein